MAVFKVTIPGIEQPFRVEAEDERAAVAAAKKMVAPSTGEALMRGLKDLNQGPAQLLDQAAAWGIGKLGSEGQQTALDAYKWLGQALAGRDYAPGQLAEEIRQETAAYDARHAAGGGGIDWARMAPGLLATLTPAGLVRAAFMRGGAAGAPRAAAATQGLMSRTAGGAATGAGAAVGLTPTGEKDYWRDAKERAIGGAIGGGAGNAFFGGLGNLHARARTQSNDELIKEGIPLTVGGLLGGGFQRMEDAMQIQPFVGGKIRARKDEFVDRYNVAELNRALEPIGQRVETPGWDSIKKAQGYASDAQKAAEGMVGRIPLDDIARQEIYDVGSRLPGKSKATEDEINRWFLNEFERRLTPQRPMFQGTGWIDPNATLSSENYRELFRSAKEGVADNLGTATGRRYDELMKALQGAAGRHDTAYVKAGENADKTWRLMARIEDASNAAIGRKMTNERFLPGDVLNYVIKPGVSMSAKRGRGTRESAVGEALGQELPTAANRALGAYYAPGQVVGLSQAGMMSFLPHLVTVGATAGASGGDPSLTALSGLIPTILGVPFYSKRGQKMAVSALRSRALNYPRYTGGVLGGAIGGQVADR